MELKGRCQCCGKPGKLRMIGAGGPEVKRMLCEDPECCAQLRHEYYEQKRKSDNIYYSNIPQYDDDDGWGY